MSHCLNQAFGFKVQRSLYISKEEGRSFVLLFSFTGVQDLKKNFTKLTGSDLQITGILDLITRYFFVFYVIE